MLGKHCIKTWSFTQGAVALSSGEAEFYALVEAVLRGKGLLTVAKEVVFVEVTEVVRAATDSSAAKGIVSRTGLGKLRHIEVNELWLQEKVRDKLIVVNKIPGTENLGDALTKHLDRAGIDKHCQLVNLTFETGRHAEAPAL